MLLGLQVSDIMIIVILEAILFIDSITLAFCAKKKWARAFNIVMAAIWAVCAVMNVIQNIL